MKTGELAEPWKWWGAPLLHAALRPEGYAVNHKQIERVNRIKREIRDSLVGRYNNGWQGTRPDKCHRMQFGQPRATESISSLIVGMAAVHSRAAQVLFSFPSLERQTTLA